MRDRRDGSENGGCAGRAPGVLPGWLCAAAWLALLACGGEEGTSVASDAARGDAVTDASQTDAGAEAIEIAIERIEIAASGMTFDARAAGPEDGPLVLLLHGFPQTSAQYRRQLTALAAAGYRAVAPDQRGYSPRARPAEVSAYGVLNLAQDVLQIADALGREQFHLVGHDWGGGIAWTVARLFPQRVQSLFMLSTPHPDAMNAELSKPDSCQTRASGYFDAFVGDDALAYLRSMGTGSQLGFQCTSDEDLSEYLKLISDDAALNAALNWYRANVKDRKFNAPGLGTVAVPTRYLWGAEDSAFCREAAEASAAFVSGSYQFEAVPDVGHWITDCAADTVTEQLLAHVAAHAGEG